MSKEITITVSGPTGSGKPLILSEIFKALKNSQELDLKELLERFDIVYVEQNSVSGQSIIHHFR